ncbi:MAG: hypothetical protein IH946_06445, partial [Bacteroidetes bacterium]|nr:hypothetical protein [Bacteroidota bacterium]
MMNDSANGADTVGNILYLNSFDIEMNPPSSDASHVDGRISRFINNDGKWHMFPCGDAGISRRIGMMASSLTTNNENLAKFNYLTHWDYLNYSIPQIPGGVINKYYWSHWKTATANVARRFYYEDNDFSCGTTIFDVVIASYASQWVEN